MFFRSRSRDWQLKRAASIGSASGSKKKKTLIPRRHVSTSGGENFGSSTWLRNIPCDANLRIFDITSTATSFSSKGRTSKGRSENWSAPGFNYSSASYALGVNVLYACTDESKTKEVAVLSIC